MLPSSNEPTFTLLGLSGLPEKATEPANGSREADLARAERRGRQVLLYAPDGPLGGTFTCTRCAATALQPDLLVHRTACFYRETSCTNSP